MPRVSQQPGFVAGYWLRPASDNKGFLSVAVFESEDNAQAAAERVQTPEGVTLESADVREVVATA